MKSAFRNPQSAISPMKVCVRMIEPVLPDRAEDVELERVLERLRLMLDPRRDVQHLAFADRDLLAADVELERALKNVGHLLALVRVHRHEAAAFEVDLREHLALARHQLPRQHLRHFFERDFIPSMQSYRLSTHAAQHTVAFSYQLSAIS